MYYVYILKSEMEGRLYKGLTNNLNNRLKQHNDGQNKSTKGFCPRKLVYFKEFLTMEAARAREKYFKSGIGRKFLKELINNRCSSSL